MKKITLDEFNKYSVVISCDKNRLEIMQKAFAKAGLQMPQKVAGVNMCVLNGRSRRFGSSRCAESIAMSHMQCINMADALGWPFVVIFEDDAWPRKNAKETLEQMLSEIPDETLVYYFGYDKLRKENGKILRAGQHAYVVFRDAFEIFRNAFATLGLETYAIDCIDRHYAPLAEVSSLSKTNIFVQMNIKDYKARYSTTYRCRAYRGPKPEEGFPTYEEVIKND